jgi:uncharacterized protein YgfB (UPF0149 family)
MAEVKIVGGGELDGATLQGAATEATLQQLVKAVGGAGSSTGAKVTAAAAQAPKNVAQLAKESKGLVDEFKNLRKQHESLSTAGKMFVGQLIRGTDQFSNYTAAFTGYIQQFGEGFALVAKGIQMLVSEVDAQVKEFRKLSQVGADFGNSIFDSRYAAINAGLSLEEFSGQVQSNAKMLALLGGSTIAGARRFQAISREIQLGFQPTLSRLGISMTETTDLMTDYLEIQTGLGRAQDMSNDQLVAGTKKYITELDLLARITGQSRKEAAEEQKKIANDKTLRLAMASLGEDASRELQTVLAAFSNDPEIQTAIKDVFVFGGSAITEEGMRLQQVMSGIVPKIQQLGQGLNAEEFLVAFGQNAKIANRNTQAQGMLLSRITASGSSFFNLDGALLKHGKMAEKVTEAQKEQAAAMASNNKRVADFQSAMTKFTNSLINLFSPLLEGATKALSYFADMISAVTTPLSKVEGFGKAVVLVTTGLLASYAAFKTYQMGKGLVKGVTSLASGGGGGGGGGSKVLEGIGKGGPGIGKSLEGLAFGLKAFGSGSLLILKGAAILAGVVALLGAGVGTAFALTGLGIMVFAKGLKSVAEIDGENLKNVAAGTKDLALAMTAMASGGLASGFANLFGAGPKNFAKNINATLDSLDKSKIESYTVALNNLNSSFAGFNNNMSKTMTAGAKSSTDKLEELNTTMKEMLAELQGQKRFVRQTAENTEIG